MHRKTLGRSGKFLLFSLAAVGLLSLSVWNFVLADKATPENLGGPDRYLTCISTDKPIYKPGEKVYVRGVLLHATNHTPHTAACFAWIEIKGPKGDTVSSANVYSADSAWGFAWEIPSGQPGGEYTLHASYPQAGYAPAERKFDIRAYRAPRLRSQIAFLRDGYGPGDKVTATLHTERSEGGFPDGAVVQVQARVDDEEILGAPGKVDASGNCTVAFDLPREIAKGDGALALIIADGGALETASKTIPILLQAVDVQLYPEGGDLVAGAPNRVYFEARTPAQKPADIAGVILNAKGAEVAHFRSEHEGRGRFEIQPTTGGVYIMRIDEPAGIKTIALPGVKSNGAILRVKDEATRGGGPVAVGWASEGYEDVNLVLSQREIVLDSKARNFLQERSFKDGSPLAWTDLDAKNAEGVLTVTISDAKSGAPLAERLVYRQSARKINVAIVADKNAYVPGGRVKLTIKTTDADGKPVEGFAGITVTDDSVLEMIEKREQAPRLPAMALLEPEVKELEDAGVFLDDANPKAPLALDLLLGTQGWRRFALVDATKFMAEHGDMAKRALAYRFLPPPPPPPQVATAAPGGFGWFGGEEKMAMAQRAEPAVRPAMAPVTQIAIAAPPPDALADRPAKVAQRVIERADAGQNGAAVREMNQLAKKDAARFDELDQEQLGQNEGLAKNKARRIRAAQPEQAQQVVVVREFTHQVRPNRSPNDRVDFAETLYWNTAVKTGANGEATVTFGLSDNVTTFRVFADVLGAAGGVASATQSVKSVQPFYVEPKLPLEVTAGDQILLPIGVFNAIDSDLGQVSLAPSLRGEFKLGDIPAFELKAMDRVRQILPIKVGLGSGATPFELEASAGPYSDKVVRTLNVKPRGFPMEVPFGGTLGANSSVRHTLVIPDSIAPHSLITHITVYPTPLANMTQALQRLIQEPSGCFEQTSSTSYPLTMAQQYFLSHRGVEPKLVEDSREKLDAGYKRLVGFWCPDRGYEWFGQDPGHEALTAFGLLHFSDMAQVREVDQHMVEQTRAWLLKQRDGKGGFERKRRALHTWIEDKDCSNAYILWALLETGAKGLDTEVAALKSAAQKSENSYVIALASNALNLAGDAAESKSLMTRLATKQDKNGMVSGGTASIVGSTGESLNVETTALAALAWMRNPEYAGNVESSMTYLADVCKAGRYGSTQSTVLALRAIVNHDKLHASPKAPGKVRVFVDGQSIGGPVSFDESTKGAITLPDLSELLTKGAHAIELKMENGASMPYSIAVNYSALTPFSSGDCKVDVTVKLAEDHVNEGAITEANVALMNKTDEAIPSPVAIVGIPGGLEPRHDQLKELVKKGTIDAYEVMGRDVVLYWRSMKAGDRIDIPLSLVAAVPGTYTGAASRAYLYYTDEHKVWVDGVTVTIAPK